MLLLQSDICSGSTALFTSTVSMQENATSESVEKYWLPRCKTFTSMYVCTTYVFGMCEYFKKAIHRAFIANRNPQHTNMVQLQLANMDTHATIIPWKFLHLRFTHLGLNHYMVTHTVLYCDTLWNSNLGRMQIIHDIRDSKKNRCIYLFLLSSRGPCG